jgi:hypothetical protein
MHQPVHGEASEPARGEGAAAGEHEAEQALAPRHSPAKLVRLGGRWLCSHELAGAYRPIAEPD